MAENTLGYNYVFDIYKSDGTQLQDPTGRLLSLGKSTLELTGMSLGDKISGDVYSNGNLQLTGGEYVVYNGVHFTLVNPPTLVYNGLTKDNSTEKGMLKYSFAFYHPMAALANMDFTDVAVSSDEKAYLSDSRKFSWIGKIADYCAKLNKNLQNTEWVCVVGDSVDEGKLNELSEVLPFDNATIADALKTFYDTWGVPYITDSLHEGEYYYVNPNNERIDYYSEGKRFVIILGYPSNEIYGSSQTESFACSVSMGEGKYRCPYAITLSVGQKAQVSGGINPSIFLADDLSDVGTNYIAREQVQVYVVEKNNAQSTLQLTVQSPYIFRCGQGLGLKNNSRTPKNNKIVTRIVGYGSENNIPYGYPQIRWYGNPDWDYTLNNQSGVQNVTITRDGETVTVAAQSYPIYRGILDGEYVLLIKHPFTRKHLMPSVYRETLFNKISPYLDDGSSNPDFDPDITLIDYHDADITYPNPIVESAPSVEIHEFEKVKPEFGEVGIVDAYPYWKTGEDAPWMTIEQYEKFVEKWKTEFATYIDGDQLYSAMSADLCDMRPFTKNESPMPSSDTISATNWSFSYNIDTSGDYFWDLTCDVTYRYYSTSAETKMVVLHVAIKTITARVLRADALGEPPAEWDDTMDEDGNYVQSYFKMVLPQLSFDLYAHASITEEMEINMRSGACIGCTFGVYVDWDDYKKNFYDKDGNFDPVIGTGHPRNGDKYPDSSQGSITVIVKKDLETFGTLMPNIYQQPHANDLFVLLGISLPESYILSAEERLDGDMDEYMLENNVYQFEYPLNFDEKFMLDHTNILAQLRQNAIVRFNFYGVNNVLYVKEMSVKYGDNPLPTYSITLADDVEVVLNQIGQTAEDVSRIRVQLNELQKYYGENIVAEMQSKLSRLVDDIALGRITFQNGINVLASAIFGGELSSNGFVHGMDTTGRGWHVDANGNAEVESLRVRSFLEVLELVVNRMSGQEGDTLFSDNDQIEAVTFVETDPSTHNRIYFLTLKEKWNGYVTNQRMGNILRGVINTLAANDAGVSDVTSADSESDGSIKYYTSWMYVALTDKEKSILRTAGILSDFVPTDAYSKGEAVLYDNRICVFIEPHTANTAFDASEVQFVEGNTIAAYLWPDSDTPANKNFAPCQYMSVARWGHVAQEWETAEEVARLQRSFYISTYDGRITKLIGVSKPKLEDANYGTTLGELPDFVKNWTGIASRLLPNKDYLYAQGIVVEDFIKVTRDGAPIINYVDCGDWDSSKTYLFEQYNSTSLQYETSDVWHNGSYWRNMSANNSNHEPALGSQYWRRLMRSGTSASQYEDIWYAWSNTATTANETTDPLQQGEGSWQDYVPQNTSNRAYLWRRSQKHVLQSGGTYLTESYKYVRLSGTNGTSVSIKNAVIGIATSPPNLPTPWNEGDLGIYNGSNTVLVYHSGNWITSSTASDGDAFTISRDCTWDGANVKGHLFMWSAEASNWVDLGQFQGQNGVTYYTHIAWATNVTFDSGGTVTNVTGGTIARSTIDDYPWMGVLVDTNSADSTVYTRYKWRYTKGDTGTSVVAQYSVDGSTGWHNTYADGDLYMRTSSDSGQTWSSGMRIVGEQGAQGEHGDYVDSSFAISEHMTTDNPTVRPEDTPTPDQWSDAPIEPTAAKSYLWCQQISHTFSGGTETTGVPTYFRITGEKGEKGDKGDKGDKGNKGDQGERGKVGRFFYYGGEFNSADVQHAFLVSDAQVPYFKHASSGQQPAYHVFNPQILTTEAYYTMAQMWEASNESWNNAPWEVMTNDFKYLITEAIFAQNAKLGSGIFSGDWLISQYGTVNGATSQQYTQFDPEHPNEDYVNPQTRQHNFVPNFAVDLLMGTSYQNKAVFRGEVRTNSIFYPTVTIDNNNFLSTHTYIHYVEDDTFLYFPKYWGASGQTIIYSMDSMASGYRIAFPYTGIETDVQELIAAANDLPNYEGSEIRLIISTTSTVILVGVASAGQNSWEAGLYTVSFGDVVTLRCVKLPNLWGSGEKYGWLVVNNFHP